MTVMTVSRVAGEPDTIRLVLTEDTRIRQHRKTHQMEEINKSADWSGMGEADSVLHDANGCSSKSGAHTVEHHSGTDTGADTRRNDESRTNDSWRSS